MHKNIYEYNKLDLTLLENDGLTLKNRYDTFLDVLKQGTTHSGFKIEQLKGSKYYSARLNDTCRVLFISVNVKYSDKKESSLQCNGKKAFVILEVLPNHEYKKSKFLKNRKIVEECQQEGIKIEEIENVEELYTDTDNSSAKVSMFGIKPILLNKKQEEIVSHNLPLVVSGSAGSGKTLVALERLRKVKDNDNIEGKILYITRSKNLIDKSRESFYDYCREDNKESNKEIEFLSVHEFLRKVDIGEELNSNISGKNPIDKNIFSLFLYHIKLNYRQSYKLFTQNTDKENLLLIEFDIITGSNPDRCLNKEEYINLGARKSVFPKNMKEEVYQLFEIYKQWVELNHKYYDINLNAHKCINNLKKIYSAVIIDEVQDFSISVLNLILGSLKEENKHQFMLCGDINQVIYPGCFSMSSLNKFLTDNNHIYVHNNIFYFLQEDYRNSEQVTELAQRVLHLKNYCCGVEDKSLPLEHLFIKSIPGNTGSIRFVTYSEVDIKTVIEENANFASAEFAVLCSTEQDKKEFKDLCSEKLGTKAVVALTVHEAKGLEFDHIMIYNPISSNESYYNNICNSIINIEANDIRELCNKMEFKRSRSKDRETKSNNSNTSGNLHGHQLNELFVQITRARKCVTIIEKEGSKKIFTRIQDIVQPKNISENISSIDIEPNKTSSPKEWKNRILELINSGNKDIVELTKTYLLDANKEGSIEYVREIINVLQDKGFSEEGKRLQVYLEQYKTATSDLPIVKIEAIYNPLTVLSSNVAQKFGVDNTTSVVKNKIKNGLNPVYKKHNSQRKSNKNNIDNGENSIDELVDDLLKSTHNKKNEYKKSKELFQQYDIKNYSEETIAAFLIGAIECGDKDFVKFLLSRGANPDAQDKEGKTPLYVASEKGHENIVELLLQYNANPNIRTAMGEAPLHVALKEDNEKIAELLLAHGANINIQDKNGIAPLHSASVRGHAKIVELLLTHGANPNIQYQGRKTSLHAASKEGKEKIVELLLTHGANVNIKDNDRETPLYAASVRGHAKIVELLLTDGADPNIQTEEGKTPLYVASDKGHAKIVELLLTNGAKVNIQDNNGRTPLYVASVRGHAKIVELLLTNGANPNIQYKDGTTLLYCVVIENKVQKETNKETLRYLFANPNTNLSIDYKNEDLVGELFEKIKVKFDAFNKVKRKIDKELFDAVQEAIQPENKNSTQKIEQLLDKDKKGKKGKKGKKEFLPSFYYKDEIAQKTVIDLVTEAKNKRILQLLFSYMVEQKMATDMLEKLLIKDNNNEPYVEIDKDKAIKYKSIEGDTFLHLVSKTGCFFEVAKYLLDTTDIDINAENDKGETPLALALENNANEKIIHLLMDDPNINVNSISTGYKQKYCDHFEINISFLTKIQQVKDIKKIKQSLELKNTLKPSLNYRDNSGNTAITYALTINDASKKKEVLQLLFDYAIKTGTNVKTIKNLLVQDEKGKLLVDINNIDEKKSEPALLIAAKNQYVNVVKFLSEAFKDTIDESTKEKIKNAFKEHREMDNFLKDIWSKETSQEVVRKNINVGSLDISNSNRYANCIKTPYLASNLIQSLSSMQMQEEHANIPFTSNTDDRNNILLQSSIDYDNL